jgi:hypothetical protein
MPRREVPYRAMQREELKEGGFNPFTIKQDIDTAIVPDQQHRKEQQLQMKLPSGILKSGSYADNLDLELVFQSARCTNEKKRVDFELEGSEFT